MSLTNKILINTQPHLEYLGEKISIIGAGMVGMASAVSILNRRVTKNLVLVDAFGDKVKGEVLDLQHGALFLKHPIISGGNDYEATKGSKLYIITAGVRQIPGESRLNLTQRNADIMVKLVPELMKHSPDALILMVGNPCDVMTYVAWKASGLPTHKVIGAGTTLDSARFKVNLAKKLNINPEDIHAWIIGEHGDHSIALWSSINLSGMRLQHINQQIGTVEDSEDWIQCHKEVVGAAQAIQELKGYTNWGIGMSVAVMAKAIISNELNVFPVSVNAKGKYGIQDDVYIPLPAVLGCNGITDIVDLHLSEKELTALQNTAKVMKEVQDGVNLGSQAHKCNCTRCKKH
ncbi:hypothetical protein HHI36_014882 [Cryptolaemus montrouzieri]|uniref:L-lactate dehydrogenase n=1 Tax=Cryptolaemus montrouzieri TaxID=559131 RepID=A0ABD2N412_9CUCU